MSISYPLTMSAELLEFESMAKRLPNPICLLVPMVMMLLTSCTPVDEGNFVELESGEYQSAKQKMREGDVEGALDAFLKVIDKYSYAPESHLEAGVIYLRNEDEPILAIYHLNRYLEQKPDGREAALVEELILSAKKQFAASLPGNPFKDAVSRMELMETIAVLKRQLEGLNQEILLLKNENNTLKQRLSGTQDTMREILTANTEAIEESPEGDDEDVRTQALVVTAQTQRQVQQMLPVDSAHSNVPDTYQVKAGDSLYAISMQFYGDSEHIQSIFQANRNILKSVNDLRPGQVLRMPK